MIEALWSVSFQSNAQLGSMGGTGVVVFETGRVFGGDSIMIYTGKYRVVNDVIEADIHVDTFAIQPGMASIVGLPTFDLKVTGPVAHDRVVLSGHVVQDPNRKMTIVAIRRAELP
jgi:hypothetical protein